MVSLLYKQKALSAVKILQQKCIILEIIFLLAYKQLFFRD